MNKALLVLASVVMGVLPALARSEDIVSKGWSLNLEIGHYRDTLRTYPGVLDVLLSEAVPAAKTESYQKFVGLLPNLSEFDKAYFYVYSATHEADYLFYFAGSSGSVCTSFATTSAAVEKVDFLDCALPEIRNFRVGWESDLLAASKNQPEQILIAGGRLALLTVYEKQSVTYRNFALYPVRTNVNGDQWSVNQSIEKAFSNRKWSFPFLDRK